MQESQIILGHKLRQAALIRPSTVSCSIKSYVRRYAKLSTLYRPANSRHNSLLSTRSVSRDARANGHAAGEGVTHAIQEHASEYTSLLSRPIKSGAEDDRPYVKWPSYFILKTGQTLTSNYVNVLLVFVPLGIISGAAVRKRSISPIRLRMRSILPSCPFSSLGCFTCASTLAVSIHPRYVQELDTDSNFCCTGMESDRNIHS